MMQSVPQAVLGIVPPLGAVTAAHAHVAGNADALVDVLDRRWLRLHGNVFLAIRPASTLRAGGSCR